MKIYQCSNYRLEHVPFYKIQIFPQKTRRMLSATKENSDADINCTSEMSLPGAMLSPSLTYDSISNKIHYPDGYFINSIYLKRNMASVDNDVATENKNLANGHSNCQIYNSGSSSDISSSNGNYNSSSLLKDVTDDTDDLKLSNDAPRKYGLSDLFNRYCTRIISIEQ